MAKNKILNRALTSVLGIFIVLLIITFSIGLPIYVRPFYYMQINLWDIPEETGHSVSEIKEAYNEMMNFLVLPNREFGTGVFKYSETGKSHFVDCKKLFNLNITVFVISLTAVVTLYVLHKKKIFNLCRPFGKHLLFTCGVSTLSFFGLLGIICVINFDFAFTVFHLLLFPNNEDWLFDPYLDEIILALPEQFFMSCGILIASSIILICTFLMIYGLKKRPKNEVS